ncbi:serine hydrolase [Lewinella sp. W8]|uniref:serine hydrolase n=1 Tax=Lewinella sp. W8 TaxID=2528208 RepID=UPI00156541C6|nr:serine hydrolase [Lewinella sp. W8]
MTRFSFALSLFLLAGCTASPDEVPTVAPQTAEVYPRYSLGQWSFHRELFSGEMTSIDFVEAAAELGFDGVEYVNQFFLDRVEDHAFLDSLAAAAAAADIAGVMLLVDNAGNLGASDPGERQRAIEQHLAWVGAARQLGCPIMRVNAHGDGTPDEIMAACEAAIRPLAVAAGREGVQIVIENHGGISNDGEWLAELVGRLADVGVGSLADFDNWCVERENGQLWGAPCTNRYDRYRGMMDLMPTAVGVSVKAFNFDAAGEEPDIDFGTMFDIIHAHDYRGFLGIEYEGDALPAREGIAATLALAKQSWKRRPVVDAAAVSRLDSTLARFVETGGVAGVSSLIYEKGEEVYFKAVGMADRERSVPMDRNTIVQIYSMTKPIAGVALMQLYEAGKFSLDDPVDKYVPELADVRVFDGLDASGKVKTVAPARPMTIRDLTRHTAGFYNGSDVPGLREVWAAADVRNPDVTLTGLAEKLGKIPLLFHPGEQWEYGISVDMQALVVERISGQPFGEYLREHVLDPLGLEDTRYFVPEEDRGRMSGAYRRQEDGSLVQLPSAEAHAFNVNPQTYTPGGFGLTSTLGDYARFGRMLAAGGKLEGVRILEPETVRRMATNHLSSEVTERLWLPSKGQVGFGVDFAVRLRPPVSAEENPGTVGEFFWDGAASTLFWVDPANDLVAVFFVQLFPYDPIGLHHGFRRAVYGPFKPIE